MFYTVVYNLFWKRSKLSTMRLKKLDYFFYLDLYNLCDTTADFKYVA